MGGFSAKLQLEVPFSQFGKDSAFIPLVTGSVNWRLDFFEIDKSLSKKLVIMKSDR